MIWLLLPFVTVELNRIFPFTDSISVFPVNVTLVDEINFKSNWQRIIEQDPFLSVILDWNEIELIILSSPIYL